MKNKNLKLGEETLKIISETCESIYKVVKQTMGPVGKYIILEQEYDDPKVIRDGVTVAKHITFKDKFKDTIAKIFKQSIVKTNDLAGDGTTATTILSFSIFKIAYKMIVSGWSSYKIIKSLKKIEKILINELENLSHKIKDNNNLINVASVSSNSLEIGKIIADAFVKVGYSGAITVDDSNSINTYLSFTEGMKISSGYISRAFLTSESKGVCELRQPNIVLISSKTENTIKDYYNIMQILLESKKDFLIIVDDIRDEIVQVFIRNKLSPLGAFKDMRFNIIKLSSYGDAKTNELKDIAISVGAKILGSENGFPLSKVTKNAFGQANKVIVYKDQTIIIGAQGNKEAILEHKNTLKKILIQTTKNFDKKELQDRLHKFGNGVAVINVGASTSSEAIDKKARIEDALNSTKSALESGIVIGGGTVYLQLIDILNKKYKHNKELEIAINILNEAFLFPIRAIISNSGQNSEYIIPVLQDKVKNNFNIGFDVVSNQFVDMFKNGIIDPTKVVKCAIINSLSVVYMLLNSNGISIKLDDNKTNKTF